MDGVASIGKYAMLSDILVLKSASRRRLVLNPLQQILSPTEDKFSNMSSGVEVLYRERKKRKLNALSLVRECRTQTNMRITVLS